jgi:hypothetical protein
LTASAPAEQREQPSIDGAARCFDLGAQCPVEVVECAEGVQHGVDLGQAADGAVEEPAQLSPATLGVALGNVVVHRPRSTTHLEQRDELLLRRQLSRQPVDELHEDLRLPPNCQSTVTVHARE